MEAGMRGYALSGEVRPSSRLTWRPSRRSESSCKRCCGGGGRQSLPRSQRLRKVQAAQKLWEQFANEMIELRRNNGDYVPLVKSGRGKIADR